jgi:ubiquinone biosynthesis O-methyltransferase
MNFPEEIVFDKYEKKGAYHWREIDRDPRLRNAFVLGRYDNMIAALEEAVGGSIANLRILDIGCGDGVIAYLLAQRGATVSGIDSSRRAIELANAKKETDGIDLRHGSAYELTWSDGYFDAVISSDVIEHVQDPQRFLSETIRVLKKDVGIAVISTPIRFVEFFDKEHVVEWYESEYQELILKRFPSSIFLKSHPIFWQELFECFKSSRILVNLLSLVWNPFSGFDSRFKLTSMQYSVSTNKRQAD